MAAVVSGHYDGTSRTPSPTGAENGGQVARTTETGERIATGAGTLATTEADNEALQAAAAEKKTALAEKASGETLKRRIARSEEKLRGFDEAERVLKRTGQWNAETAAKLAQDRADVQQTLDIDKKAQAEKTKAAKKTKAKQQEIDRRDTAPKIAKRDFRTDALNLFSIPAGSRTEVGRIVMLAPVAQVMLCAARAVMFCRARQK